ncbi:FAD:protein FMN transferase [Buchnera aphidicola]|uniref:FAD:protein FMN transferase n=1 Tax=Buchnera aphidicola TaxID=9 RepID=UPI0001ECFEE8|nr:FAD:protein FMN transferase [Buchnera aphidicola]ADP66049.1 hypothetical protein CWO_01185 [Buchnera aphidicola str. LL01 (Acyrthosiphon pisum)]
MSLKIIYSVFIFFIFIVVNFYNRYLDREKQNIATLTGKTMGTYWQVKIPNLKNKKYIKNLIQQNLDEDEKMLSSWKKNSLVSQFNRLKKHQRQIINQDFF